MMDDKKAQRLENALTRGPKVTITVDGREIEAHRGETVVTALLADGNWTCQQHEGRSLGVFCNIGVCHSCLMDIDGFSGVRACQTEVKPGMTVETRHVVKDRSR